MVSNNQHNSLGTTNNRIPLLRIHRKTTTKPHTNRRNQMRLHTKHNKPQQKRMATSKTTLTKNNSNNANRKTTKQPNKPNTMNIKQKIENWTIKRSLKKLIKSLQVKEITRKEEENARKAITHLLNEGAEITDENNNTITSADIQTMNKKDLTNLLKTALKTMEEEL